MTHKDDNSFWSALEKLDFKSEADVEHLLVVPLLLEMGYEREDLKPKAPVLFAEGRRGRHHEADYVAYSSHDHSRDTSLIVIEAKKPGEGLAPAKQQAESYASNLRCPFYVLLDGENLELWQMQVSRESRLILQCRVSELQLHRGKLEATISKKAAIAWCQHLDIKEARIPNIDPKPYFASLPSPDLRDFNNPHVHRRVKNLAGNVALTSEILERYPRGFILIGTGGLGKTNFFYDVLHRMHSDGVLGQTSVLPIYMRAYDAEHEGGLEEYARNRVSSYLRQLHSKESFREWMRMNRVILLVDAAERARDPGSVASEVRSLLRDFDKLQICFATRRISRDYGDIGLIALRMLSLDDDECISLIAAYTQRSQDEAKWSYWRFPVRLRRQCENPFVLLRVLNQQSSMGQTPKSAADALREWIERQIDADLSESISLRQALSLLAWECLDGPISPSATARVTSSFGAPILDRMEIGGFIEVTDGKVDFQEDVLIDALVALDICERASDGQSIGPALEKLGKLAGRGIDVALFVIQWLDSHYAHKPLWDLILEHSLLDYLEAVATRADASDHVPESGDWFLGELLEGVDCIFRAHMPALRAGFFSLDEGSKPAVIGGVDTTSLRYGFHCVSNDSATAVLTREVPQFAELWRKTSPRHYINLPASGVRIDGPRLIAAQAVRDHLKKKLIERDRLVNDELWVKERLLGFLAWHFGGRTVSELLDATPDSLWDQIVSLQDEGRREFYDGTLIKDVIADLERAIAWGWGQVGEWDPDHASLTPTQDGSDRDASAAFVAREYRKTVLLYKSAVLGSMPQLKDRLRLYPILPLEYRLYLLSEAFEGPRRLVVFDGWVPVRDWRDMKVECIWANSRHDVPSRTEDEEVEQVKAALRGLGRPTNVLNFGGSHNFGTRSRSTTWALESARTMLLGEIDHLFASVRTTDFYPSMAPVIAASERGVPIVSMKVSDD